MYKLISTWSAPNEGDAEDFELAYWDTHVPLASQVPGMRRLVLTRTDSGLEGNPAPFYRVAELIFDSPEEFEQAEHSEEWRRLREDAGRMIERFGVTLTTGMGYDHDHPLGR